MCACVWYRGTSQVLMYMPVPWGPCYSEDSNSTALEQSPRFHISNKFPSVAEVWGPWTMLCIARWLIFKRLKQLTYRTHSSLIMTAESENWKKNDYERKFWIIKSSILYCLKWQKDKLMTELNELHSNQGGRMLWTHKLVFNCITEKDLK